VTVANVDYSENQSVEAKKVYKFPRIREAWERLISLHVLCGAFREALECWSLRCGTAQEFPEFMRYSPPFAHAQYADIGYGQALLQERVGLNREPLDEILDAMSMVDADGNHIGTNFAEGECWAHYEKLRYILHHYGSVNEWARAKTLTSVNVWRGWAHDADHLFVHARRFYEAVQAAYQAVDNAAGELDRVRGTELERAIPIRRAIGMLESAAYFDYTPTAIVSLPRFDPAAVVRLVQAMEPVKKHFQDLKQEAAAEVARDVVSPTLSADTCNGVKVQAPAEAEAAVQQTRPTRKIPAPPANKAAAGPTRIQVILWEGADHSERNIRLARTRTAYLEAHGDVVAALAALETAGTKIGQSTFYDHLNSMDEACPGWRSHLLMSGPPGNPENGVFVRTRGK